MSKALVMVCDVDLNSADATKVHTVEVARGFARAGLSVELVARGGDPRINGVRYTPAAGAETQKLRRLLSMNLHTIRLLWRHRSDGRRMYVRNSWTLLASVVVARLLRFSVVNQVDGIPYGEGFEGEVSLAADYGKRLTLLAMGRLAGGTVAITDRIKGLLVDQFRVPARSVSVLPNGADVDFFTPMDRGSAIERVGLDPACSYVLYCGGLHMWVDFDLLLGAFASVTRRRSDARLLFVGDGAEHERIERTAADLGMREAVIITGVVHERERIRDYLGVASVTLVAYDGMVNRNGALPSKVPEYLAAGRPVVAKHVPGLAEAIEDADAGIVVPGEPAAMAAAILALLEDPELAERMGASARSAAVEHYSWESIIARTLAMYDAIEGHADRQL
jgi:glycosyltransferase involved in cell wall biosynthesis